MKAALQCLRWNMEKVAWQQGMWWTCRCTAQGPAFGGPASSTQLLGILRGQRALSSLSALFPRQPMSLIPGVKAWPFLTPTLDALMSHMRSRATEGWSQCLPPAIVLLCFLPAPLLLPMLIPEVKLSLHQLMQNPDSGHRLSHVSQLCPFLKALIKNMQRNTKHRQLFCWVWNSVWADYPGVKSNSLLVILKTKYFNSSCHFNRQKGKF